MGRPPNLIETGAPLFAPHQVCVAHKAQTRMTLVEFDDGLSRPASPVGRQAYLLSMPLQFHREKTVSKSRFLRPLAAHPAPWPGRVYPLEFFISR